MGQPSCRRSAAARHHATPGEPALMKKVQSCTLSLSPYTRGGAGCQEGRWRRWHCMKRRCLSSARCLSCPGPRRAAGMH